MSKVMTMKEAVARFVKSGDILFLSGMQHGEPAAAVHEIVRQKIDHLTLVSALTATSNLLLGEGLLDKAITAYFNQDLHSYVVVKAKAMNRLPVFEEISHFGLSAALMAGQMGVPFLPIKSQIGSDLAKYNKNLTTMKCPFTGQPIGAIRAINPDTGIIHVQRADKDGNAQKWGTMGVDMEGINASRKIIVTTEKIVDGDVIRRDPNRTIIPSFRVSAVVEQPFGAHPMHLAGCYSGDMWGYYFDTGPKENYDTYVEKLVYGVKDWEEYLKKRAEMKPAGYFQNFKITPVNSEPVVSGF
ncbi:MAG: CoA-transferase [Dehalococcoidales bacterium]|jgi:glutaconate CoA-transferase subunit A